MVSYRATNDRIRYYAMVLILIVVDNGLVLSKNDISGILYWSLNPYCSGQWSRTDVLARLKPLYVSLNPYCSGQWSRTNCPSIDDTRATDVLILIVVDNGLVPSMLYLANSS